MSNKIWLGINKDGDLVELELNFNDLNKGTKFYNPHYYLSFSGYNNIIDEEQGEQEARERLEDEEYYKELGYLGDNNNMPNFLVNHIDFKAVAEEIISNDGWQNTNGEFIEIGFYNDKTYYVNAQWFGFEKENCKRKDYKKIFVSEEDFKFLMNNLKDIKEKQEDKIRELKTIFSKYQDTNKIIEVLLADKEQN